MNFPQYEYTVAGFRALEVYPFTKTAKRYLRGFRENNPNQVYRIVVYPHKFVKKQQLIATLNLLKQLAHSSLSKIDYLYEETTLIKFGQKQEQEQVTAVVFEEVPVDGEGFICLFDFIVQMGHLSETLVKDFTFSLIQLLLYMNQKGFSNCFNSNDVLFQKNTGKIRIDNYGDSQTFVLKQETVSDVWQLGSLLFTMLKGNPPYFKKSLSDPHYQSLAKGQFEKFWSIVHQKTVKNPSENATNFLNACFQKDTKLQNLRQRAWLVNYTLLSEQERAQQIQTIIAQKQQKQNQRIVQQRERKQKMNQAARERAFQIHKRGTYEAQVQNFLDHLLAQQQRSRSFEKNFSEDELQKIKIKVAHLFTLLHMNENKDIKISQIVDKKDRVTLKISGEVGECINIDSQVELQIRNQNNQITFVCRRIQGNLFESLWINNFIKDLCAEI